jgi:DNA-binding response OmpR family regulator
VAQRILVVDDVAEMRSLVRRALSAGGYEVDAAATLAAALGMDPGSYDAVLVDANLGAERGADLIETLRSRDEAMAARCLIMTGGTLDMLPAGVATLTKPFQLGELLDAVRARLRPTAPSGRSELPERGGRGGRGERAGVPADADTQLPAAGPRRAAEPQVDQLLGIIRRLRARERRDLADYLHDGPIQELTAASLELQLRRRSAPAALGTDSVQQQVDTAAGSLRGLVDESWPLQPAQTSLTEVISARTAWLLAAPAAVDGDLPAARGVDEVARVADIVELMLLTTETAGPPARAHVTVRADPSLIQIDLTRTPERGDQTASDLAAAQPALDGLAAALGADVHAELSGQQSRVCLTLRR